MFRRSFSVFVQYFRRVLKNVDNKQVSKPEICDVFACSFGRTRGKRKISLHGSESDTAIVYH